MKHKHCRILSIILTLCLVAGMLTCLTGCTEKDVDNALTIIEAIDAMIDDKDEQYDDVHEDKDDLDDLFDDDRYDDDKYDLDDKYDDDRYDDDKYDDDKYDLDDKYDDDRYDDDKYDDDKYDLDDKYDDDKYDDDYYETQNDNLKIKENGTYTSKEEVAAYIHQYGHLPSNYITKDEAKDLGWVSSEKNLWKVAPGMSIGGDYFGNYEGLLPKKKGRSYTECDIDFNGKSRGAKRIIFSNDGLIFYTDDHYESFEQLY